nr:MAG TPA: hypothetical protein [Caudoviricetes sp.]
MLFGVRAGIIIKIFLYGQINGRAYCLGLRHPAWKILCLWAEYSPSA